ncbi:MAG: hypothetical protein ACI9VR_005284 [Cognaticolwellia sp.]|jgi:hypothetical protein
MPIQAQVAVDIHAPAEAQRITTLPNGDTRYSSVDVFRGLLSIAIPFARVQKGFEVRAQALKTTVEATVMTSGSPQ